MQMQCAKHNENKHNITNFPTQINQLKDVQLFRCASISWFQVFCQWVSEWFTVQIFSKSSKTSDKSDTVNTIQVLQVIQTIQAGNTSNVI